MLRRRARTGLKGKKLASIASGEIWTLVHRPRDEGPYKPVDLSWGMTPSELDVAIANARRTGISHVFSPSNASSENLGDGIFRLIRSRSTTFLDALLVTDLATELHPPEEDCWEVYALQSGAGLLTPDLAVPIPNSDNTVVAAFLPLVNVPKELVDAEELGIVVSCRNPRPTGSSHTFRLGVAP